MTVTDAAHDVTDQRLPGGAEELISAAKVQAAFERLADELQPLVMREDCVLLGVMNGGLYPLMQLAMRLQGDYLIDYCHVSRYGDGTTGGELNWLRPPPQTIRNRTVLVVDDIYDEGETLLRIAAACRDGGATSTLTVAAFVKDNPRRTTPLMPDFTTGITVPDRYVFGCGMDYAGRWRHLPAIYALTGESGG